MERPGDSMFTVSGTTEGGLWGWWDGSRATLSFKGWSFAAKVDCCSTLINQYNCRNLKFDRLLQRASEQYARKLLSNEK